MFRLEDRIRGLPQVPRGYERDPALFIEAVRVTLAHWVSLHTNPTIWASITLMVIEDQLESIREPEAGAGFVEYPGGGGDYIANVALKVWRESRMTSSGCVLFNPADCALYEVYDFLKERDIALRRKIDEVMGKDDNLRREAFQAYRQNADVLEIVKEKLYKLIPDEMIWEALVGPMWRAYRDSIDYMDDIIDRNRTLVMEIEKASNAHDMLAATSVATESFHGNGLIFSEDSVYCEDTGFEAFGVLEKVRSHGWRAAFGDEAIDRFVKEGSVVLT